MNVESNHAELHLAPRCHPGWLTDDAVQQLVPVNLVMPEILALYILSKQMTDGIGN